MLICFVPLQAAAAGRGVRDSPTRPSGTSGKGLAFLLNLVEILHTVLELRRQSNAADQVENYLLSLFRGSGLAVQQRSFFYSMSGFVPAGVAAFLLAAVFVMGVTRRRHRLAAAVSVLIPFIILCEVSLRVPVVSWPFLKRGRNVVVQFPVQNASQRVALYTQYGAREDKPTAQSPVEQTVSAFLLPASLVLLAMGVWQLLLYFGKFESEDARTVMVAMGAICVVYFALWTVVSWKEASRRREPESPTYNAGSIAVLAGIASDMGQRNPRLENTWVTVAFLGGDSGQGARAFARKLSRNRKESVEAILIGCHDIGRDGDVSLVTPLDERDSFSEQRLVQLFSAVATEAGRLSPEVFPSDAPPLGVSAAEGFPSVELASSVQSGLSTSQQSNGINETELAPVAHMIESVLVKMDSEQSHLRLPLSQR